MPKQIKCILDWKNNQRACTSQYGQALRKRMDPLEGFLFTNPENKFPVIFEVCATHYLSSQVKIDEFLCFKHKQKFGFGNGVKSYCVFI